MMKQNGHENLNSFGTGGTSILTKGRKTTYEERVEIVTYYIEYEMDDAQTAEKQPVSCRYVNGYENINPMELKAG